MILTPDKRIVPRAALSGFKDSNKFYRTASPGGPQGSALMSFFCVLRMKRFPLVAAGTQYLFGTTTFGSSGWGIVWETTQFGMGAGNATPALIRTNYVPTIADIGKPLILMCAWNSGTASGWVNGVATTPVVTGTGFTSAAQATCVGINPLTVQSPVDFEIMECGHLDNYDFGANSPTTVIYPQFAEDLQQGRYLTLPRAMTANDHYWSARDAVLGPMTRATWTDRGPNAVVMNRTGAPQSGAVPTRF